MAINARPTIPPMTLPAMTPAWLFDLECEGEEDAVGDIDALAEDVLAEEVDTPEAPKIAPGPYSGPSKSNRFVCEIANEEQKGNIKETKPLTTSGIRCINVPYVFILESVVIMVLFF